MNWTQRHIGSLREWVLALILSVVFWEPLAGQQAETLSRYPMVSAHRGASHDAPENTWAAFSRAIALGADFLEIDVRTTADGVQVILHDESLKRTTGEDLPVRKATMPEIKKLSAGKWYGQDFLDEKILTLEELCFRIMSENRKNDRTVKLYVDCKDIDTGEVVRILNQYRLLDSAVFYGNHKTLSEIQRFHDRARVMPAYQGKNKLKRTIRKLHPYAVDVPYPSLDEATVSACRANGIKVFSDLLGEYDTPACYRRAMSVGVDLIQTDNIPSLHQTYKNLALHQP